MQRAITKSMTPMEHVVSRRAASGTSTTNIAKANIMRRCQPGCADARDGVSEFFDACGFEHVDVADDAAVERDDIPAGVADDFL